MIAPAPPALTEVIEEARMILAGAQPCRWPSAADAVTGFARALVQLGDRCVVGLPCERHGGVVHGCEAEELRKGIEKILADPPGDDIQSNYEWRVSLLRMLDEVDARDSLACCDQGSE